jgi:rfaE bifunctional protein kinase chain/domain
MHEAREMLPRMRGRRVVVVGDLMADEYVWGETRRISREAPVPVVEYVRSEVRPGGAANAAANVQSLGGHAIPVGVVGRDASGESLLDLLTAAGLDTRHVLRTTAPTATKTRILAGALGVGAQQVLRLDRTPTRDVYGALEAPLLLRLEAALAAAPDALLVSDYGDGVLSPPMIAAVVRVARERALPVIVDSRHRLPAYRGVTAVTPNEPELRATSPDPTALTNDAALFDLARSLHRDLDAHALLLKRGRLGAVLFPPAPAAPVVVPPFGRDQVVDVTGAGDTVIAAFTLARCAGASWATAAVLANAAAGLAVTVSGAAQVTAAQLDAALAAAVATT